MLVYTRSRYVTPFCCRKVSTPGSTVRIATSFAADTNAFADYATLFVFFFITANFGGAVAGAIVGAVWTSKSRSQRPSIEDRARLIDLPSSTTTHRARTVPPCGIERPGICHHELTACRAKLSPGNSRARRDHSGVHFRVSNDFVDFNHTNSIRLPTHSYDEEREDEG